MVNFNDNVTTGTPAVNLVRLLVLEARYNCFLALEYYNTKVSSGINIDQSTVRARLGTWFLEHQAYLERSNNIDPNDKPIYERIKENLFFKRGNLNNKEILEIVYFLNKVIDRLKVTKLDTRIQFDTTDIEEDNKQNEY